MAATNVQAFSGDVEVASNLTVPFVTGLGYLATRTYTFNPTSNTSRYFLGWTSEEGMEIEINDTGNSHGSTQRFYITYNYGETPYVSSADVSNDKEYNFYYTKSLNRLYIWFNETRTSADNNVIYTIRMKTLKNAINLTEPSAGETYGGTVIGTDNLSAFPGPILFKREGRVGIGTSNPQAPLDVSTGGTSGTQRTALKLTTPESATGTGCNLDFIQDTANVGRLASVYEGNAKLGMAFSTWNSSLGERMRIRNDGKVGIGTNNPASELSVAGHIQTIHDTGSNDIMGLFSAHYGDFLHIGAWNAVGSASKNIVMNYLGGKVGIGTSNPLTSLHVSAPIIAGESAATLTLHNTHNIYERGRAYIKAEHDGAVSAGNKLTFWTRLDTAASYIGTNYIYERMCIKNSGYVGIGTNNPVAQLDVAGTQSSGISLQLRSGDASNQTDSVQIIFSYDGYPFNNGGYAHCIRTRHNGGADQANAIDFWIWNQSNTGNNGNLLAQKRVMTIEGTGHVGVGTASPGHAFEVGLNTSIISRINNKSQQPHVMLQSATSHWQIWNNGSDDNLRFWCGVDRAYLQCAGGNDLLNFTGQHRTFINNIPFSQANDLQGFIVSADQNKYIKMSGGIEAGSNAITINESLPIVSLSNVVQDKRCFGVISLSEDPDTRSDCHGNMVSLFEKENGDTRVYINSVGEGALWVTNINGPLESGDYITTSNIAGYGQKQNSDSLKNYTVAKITMDCDFNPVTQPIKKLKQELGDVEYWVSTEELDVSEEEYLKLEPENRKILTNTRYSNGEYDIDVNQYETLDSNTQSTFTEVTENTYIHIKKEYGKQYKTGLEREVRRELVNVLDEHGQIQWEDDPSGATEKAYKIRYLDADGNITDEANHVYKAAFVGCTYHCG